MSLEQQLIAWRRELHKNPELSGEELQTTARLRRALDEVDHLNARHSAPPAA